MKTELVNGVECARVCFTNKIPMMRDTVVALGGEDTVCGLCPEYPVPGHCSGSCDSAKVFVPVRYMPIFQMRGLIHED